MILLIRDAAAIFSSAYGRQFAEEADLEYRCEFVADLVRVWVPDYITALRLFKRKKDQLAKVCREFGQEAVELMWSVSNHPLTIPATPSASSTVANGEIMTLNTIQVPERSLVTPGFTGIKRYSRQLLKQMDEALESSDRISIVRLSDQVQVFITDGFAEMLATPAEVAVGRTMKVGWHPSDLDSCMQQVKQKDRFLITYTSGLNPTTCAVLDAEVHVIDDGYEQYRVNRNLDCKVVDWPDDMKLLTSFEW